MSKLIISAPKLAANIQSYLDKGFTFEQIQANAERQGVDSHTWERAVGIVERKQQSQERAWLRSWFGPKKILIYLFFGAVLWFGLLKPADEELTSTGLYINRKNGIEFQVPEGWNQSSIGVPGRFSKKSTVFVNAEQSAFGVERRGYSPTFSLEDSVNGWENIFASAGAEALPQKNLIIGSENAIMSTVKIKDALTNGMLMINCFVRSGEYEYMFLLSAETKNLKSAEKDFQAMLKTVIFR